MKLQAAKKGSSTILLTLLVASIFLLPQSTSAYSKPSTPEFTARYVDYSYYVAPVYGTDEFTGQTSIKQKGYTVDGKSIEFTIKNQPFTTYTDSEGNLIGLYFNFRYKGTYGTQWTYNPFYENGDGAIRYGCTFFSFTDENPQIAQSSSEFTFKNFTLAFMYGYGENALSIGDKVDVEVQALIGHIDYVGDGYYVFTGQKSDWSGTQTVTIGSSSPAAIVPPVQTSTPTSAPAPQQMLTSNSSFSPTESGTQQGFALAVDWQTVVIEVLVVVGFMLALVVVLQHRNRT
jgi:hypothetical protein